MIETVAELRALLVGFPDAAQVRIKCLAGWDTGPDMKPIYEVLAIGAVCGSDQCVNLVTSDKESQL